jgi:DNA-binding transcriptional LysR family regulator
MSANNGDFLKAMALSGQGITSLPSFLVWQEIAQGSLVRVLEGYELETTQAYAMYPQNRYLPKRARLFIEFIAQRFGESPYWDKDL